ncbi:hypothetical protein D3C73_263420 [compost metagenome]
MAKLDEIAKRTKTQLADTLHTAVDTISTSQKITFKLYVKQVLPLDGFIYWVRADLVNPAELERLGLDKLKKAVTIQGSLHRQAVSEQTTTASQSMNYIIFTPLKQIDDFNMVDPKWMYLGDYDGVQFSFSRMESKYTQAGIFHYRGLAVLPTLRTQIIDDPADINTDLILSNSTPIWMRLTKYGTVYPSYLSPSDMLPPYIVADVKETKPLQAAPHYLTRSQHVQDTVRVTLYGMNNKQALDYVDYIVNEALDFEEFGITNSPVVIDDKLNQVEINALAKKKHIDFDVNYYQHTARNIALQLIKEAFITLEIK